MTKKIPANTEFAALFKDAKPVVHDKYVPSRKEKTVIIRQHKATAQAKHKNAGVQLSDEFEAHWPDHKPISYVKTKSVNSSTLLERNKLEIATDTIEKDLIKKLKMGHIPPDIEIDLHGQTSQQAKQEIIAVIFEAKKRHYPCINIIHGHGNGVLKQKVPNWLVQHPDVAGFIQAPRAYGGKAGLLVLIGLDFNAYKL